METYFIGSAVIGQDDFEICIGSKYRRNKDPKATTCVFELLIFEGEPDEMWVPVTDILQVQEGLRISITCEDEDTPKLDFNIGLIDGEFMPCDIQASNDNGFIVNTHNHNNKQTQALINFDSSKVSYDIKTDGTYIVRRAK